MKKGDQMICGVRMDVFKGSGGRKSKRVLKYG